MMKIRLTGTTDPRTVINVTVNSQQRHISVILAYVLTLFWLLSMQGCTEQRIQKLQGAVQGTTYHISYWAEEPVDDKAIRSNINAEFAAIDKTLSNYRPDSIIETFNNAETTNSQEVGTEIVSLVRLARTVYLASRGCYDLTVKPLFDLWGFQHDQQTVPAKTAIVKVLKQIGMDKLEIVDDTHLRKKLTDLRVDLSSVAQGYSVQRISQVLEQNGIGNYLVEIGGELKTHGHKPDYQSWRIAVEKPLPGEQALQKVITMPKDLPYAVMTSGTYRHYFDENGMRYSHILDARTGRPIDHDLVSVTVIHQDPVIADAWSTALLCLGSQDGMKAANTEKIAALFIRQQDKVLIESRSDPLNALKILTIH